MPSFPKIKGQIKFQSVILITILLIAGCVLFGINTSESKFMGGLVIFFGLTASAFAFVEISVAERYGKLINYYEKLARTHLASIKSMHKQTETGSLSEGDTVGSEEDGYRVAGQETRTD